MSISVWMSLFMLLPVAGIAAFACLMAKSPVKRR